MGDFLGVEGVADLVWVLCHQRHTVLLKLSKCLAFTLGAAPRRIVPVILDKGLETEFYSDGHQVRVLCYGLIRTDHLQKLLLLNRGELYAPCLFDPHHLLLGLLIYFDKGATRDQ